MPAISRAIISVSEKAGIVEFARALHGRGVELLSTGGTARLLTENDIPVTEVAEYTGFPEMMDGRVKTLHPKIHGGILGRRGDDNLVMMENGMLTIKGERSVESAEEGDHGYRRVERVHGTFYRRFALPDSADPDAVSARGANGVLEVVIQKKSAVQPKRIAVAA